MNLADECVCQTHSSARAVTHKTRVHHEEVNALQKSRELPLNHGRYSYPKFQREAIARVQQTTITSDARPDHDSRLVRGRNLAVTFGSPVSKAKSLDM